MKDRIRKIIVAVLLVIAVCCAGYLIWYYATAAKTKQSYDDAKKLATENVKPSKTDSDDGEQTKPEIPVDFTALQEKNPDIYAWIKIDGTTVDYPVCQNNEDDNYYLSHGTAIVVLAGIINALKVTGKKKEDCKIVVNGAGSAGVAITKLLLTYGFPKITMCDINGIISADSPNLNWMQKEMTKVTNLDHETGTLADALKGADIFVGVSAPNIVSQEMVASMNKDAILFAMANPVPEIMPDLAKAAGAKVVGTGRSDFPNQVNNVVAFPGIFKGALEGRAPQITEEMKLATAKAIAGLVPDEELNEDNILPEAFDPRVSQVVSEAVKALI